MTDPTPPLTSSSGGSHVEPPDSVSGQLGDGGVLLGLDGNPIGTYQFTGAPWAAGRYGASLSRVSAMVAGVEYRATTSAKVGARFNGLSDAGRAKAQLAAKANGEDEPSPQSADRAKLLREALLETACLSLRREVVEALKSMDPEGYEEYGRRKYANGPNPSLDVRRAAYVFAFERLLAACYTVPEF